MSVVLDLDNQVITIDGTAVSVSRTCARLLECIARGRGSNECMISALYPNPDTEPERPENVVTCTISRFRSECRRAGVQPPIATRHGFGYVAMRSIEIVMVGAPIVIPAKFRTDLYAILAQSNARSAAAIMALVGV